MKQNKEYEVRSAEILIDSDSESRKVCGYAVRFDSDSVDMGFTERICKGAITEDTIRRSDVLALLNHNSDKVLARSKFGVGSMKLTVDDKGLFYEFDAPDTEAGNELLQQLRRQEITASSFAFTVKSSAENERWYRDANGVSRRDIYHIEQLYDCSPVYFPAYEMTSCSRRSLEALTADEIEKTEELEKEPQTAEETRSEEVIEQVAETPAQEPNDVPEPVETETVTENAEEPAEETVEEPVTVEQNDTENTEEAVAEPVETVNDNDTIEEPKERSLEASETNNKNSNIRTTMNSFNLLKAIRSVAFNEKMDAITESVLAKGAEEWRASGRELTGQIQIPSEIRTITITDEHDDVVEAEVMDLIRPLFANKVLGNARQISGLKGDVRYPIISKTLPGVGFEGEITQDSESSNTFNSILLQPHRLSGTIYVSKQFLLQESVGAQQALSDLLIESLAQKLEKTYLGAGAADNSNGKNIPAGLFYGVTSGSVSNFKDLCSFEGQALENCYNLDAMRYILNPKAWAEIRGTFQYGGKTTRMVMEGNEIDGRAFDISQNLGAANSKTIALVNWDDIVAATWAGVELSIDSNSVTMARSGQVAITVSMFVDIKRLRDEAVQLATIGSGSTTIDPSVGA